MQCTYIPTGTQMSHTQIIHPFGIVAIKKGMLQERCRKVAYVLCTGKELKEEMSWDGTRETKMGVHSPLPYNAGCVSGQNTCAQQPQQLGVPISHKLSNIPAPILEDG